MDVEYTWTLWRKIVVNLELQFPLAFINRTVYPVGGEGDRAKEGDGGDRKFSPLQGSLYHRT